MSDTVGEMTHPRRRRSWTKRVRLPLVSGKTSVLVLVLCFAMTGVLVVPVAGRFPAWIDFEIVLALWWVVWAVTLARYLYTGQRIDDDHTLNPPRLWFFSSKTTDKSHEKKQTGQSKSSSSSSSGSGWNLLDGFDLDFEGCAVVAGVIVAVIVALIGIWLLVEIVIPGLAFLAYFMIRSMLARVANDQHGCEESLVRSILWGSLWATIYIIPQALLVWFLHAIHGQAPVT